jgi:hypothetical protein
MNFSLLSFVDEKIPLSFDEYVMEAESSARKAEITGPSSATISNVRHSTPIYQMLERIENKVL